MSRLSRRPQAAVALGALLVLLGASSGAAQPTLPFAQRLKTPVTANFQDVDFAAAMEFLSQQAGINIILSEQARQLGRAVSVHLVEMPMHRALEYLLGGQGLQFRFDEEAIWVATRDEMEAEPMETRVFPLSSGPGLFAAFEPLPATRESVALQGVNIKEMRTIKDLLAEVIPEVGESSILLDERSGSLVVTH
ncbi:MAG: hypothetical protein COV75_04500, partial [Candidatus Omnitrophica bacterium CG11_big_fil_rev_8_21_14_0_20_63_9]